MAKRVCGDEVDAFRGVPVEGGIKRQDPALAGSCSRTS